ncbi:hypothetical protein [Xanthomonas phage JGB6]|nr:hypothetical protein [Xanthomonas phage JGB6]
MEVKARLSQTDNIETWIQLRVGSGFVGGYNINTMVEKYLRLPRSVGLAFKIVTDDPDTWGVVQVELNSFENLHVINSMGVCVVRITK